MQCELCGGTQEPFSKLIDQNKHTWHICAECIAFLWKYRQQENMIELGRQGAEAIIEGAMELLKAMMNDWIQNKGGE